MFENPWAYNESRNRLREKQEKEKERLEKITEEFDREKKINHINRRFDIFELKQKIETTNSLSSLRKEIQSALKEGLILPETFNQIERKINFIEKNSETLKEKKEKHENGELSDFYDEDFPFDDTELAKKFATQKIWENLFIDIAGFSYGFFVQGSSIIIILIYKIIHDFLFLPRDIYKEIKQR